MKITNFVFENLILAAGQISSKFSFKEFEANLQNCFTRWQLQPLERIWGQLQIFTFWFQFLRFKCLAPDAKDAQRNVVTAAQKCVRDSTHNDTVYL